MGQNCIISKGVYFDLIEPNKIPCLECIGLKEKRKTNIDRI